MRTNQKSTQRAQWVEENLVGDMLAGWAKDEKFNSPQSTFAPDALMIPGHLPRSSLMIFVKPEGGEKGESSKPCEVNLSLMAGIAKILPISV